jgi:FAD/FMN-containing dehydrogenase
MHCHGCISIKAPIPNGRLLKKTGGTDMTQAQRYFANRREFLASAGALVAAGTAVTPAAAQIFSAREVRRLKAQRALPEAAWAQLARAMPKGQVVRPTDPDYGRLVLPNNLRFADPPLPLGVARCTSAKDVAGALLWAREHKIPLVTRGGGHSYGGYSTTDGLMIETSRMNHTHYDPGTGRLSVGAGGRNSDLYAKLAETNRAITHGRCPSVGAAGFLLGGGIGFNMRAHGLACDQLVGAEVVLANGMTRVVSTTSTGTDKDLFWALRGCGGGNLAISTAFDLQTFDVSETLVTVFELTWSSTPETRRRVSVEDLGARLLATLDAAPDTLGSRVSFGTVTPAQVAAGYDVPISVLGQYIGPQSALEALLKPVTDLAEPTGGFGFKERRYWEAQTILHEDGYPTFYQERSAFVKKSFGVEELAAGLAHLRRWPGTYGYCDLRFFQTGGKVNTPLWSDTAFVHRESRWLMVVGLYWNESDNHDEGLLKRNHAWQDAFYDAMRPLAGPGAYQNFADPSLADYRQAYYGQNLARLQGIKAALDPRGVFNFPQAI